MSIFSVETKIVGTGIEPTEPSVSGEYGADSRGEQLSRVRHQRLPIHGNMDNEAL